VVPLLQPDEFTTNSPFPAKIAENRFDQVVFGLQQAADDLTRAIRLPPADTVSSVLLPAASRANRYLAFAPDGSLAYAVPQPAGPGTTEAYWWGGTAGGTANALTISVGGPPTAYADGQRFAFVVASNNTGAATLNVNGLGAKAINRPNGNALQAGDLVAGELVGVTYVNGTFWLSSALVPERRILTANLTNSTIINVSGFSLQNYERVTLLVLGARLSSAASGNMTAEITRNGTLVTTGYTFVRETATGTTMTVGTTSDFNVLGLTLGGMNTKIVTITLDIVQSVLTGDVLIHAHVLHHSSPGNNITNFRAACIVTDGSGWADGVRIIAPAAFLADVGRIIVLGLRR
jgi:hypothetical protein